MRLKRGRPDIARYADRFDVPAAGDDFAVTFLGVSSLLFRAGGDALLTDGFFSRPSLLRVGLRTIGPDEQRIDGVLARAGIARLAAVMPVHTHFDHALDSAVVAARTGATLVGGESAAQVGRGGGLPAERVTVVTSGQQLRFGSFALTFVMSTHCPPDRYPGAIGAPVVPPARVDAWRCGDAWSIVIEHESGRTALVQGSAGYVAGSLAGRSAAVAYLGVGQLGLQDDDYVSAYWEHTVRAVGARRAVLIHWDDFFRPLDQPLRALPYAGDDLDATMRRLDALAQRDGVTLHFPTVFRREDPWQRLGDVTGEASPAD
jgi:L-ascorbate metabolism protein UlaG (beta-lactamase superfamily)